MRLIGISETAAAVGIISIFAVEGMGALHPQSGAYETCYMPVDIVQVQDMTSSFDSLWPALSSQIAGVIESIEEINPRSRFGFTTFGDKPLHNPETGTPLGFNYDYCFHVDMPLGHPDPKDMEKLFSEYTKHAGGGGGDWPEASLEGVVRALLAEKRLDWGQDVNSTRVIVMVTDAMSHVDRDVLTVTSLELPEFRLTVKDLEEDENNLCNKMEYPSVRDVAKILNETESQLLVLAAPGGIYGADGKFHAYASIAMEGKEYRGPDNLAKWYRDVFEREGVSVYSTVVDSEMKEYGQSFRNVLEQFQTWRCATSTTTSPTTTPTTTTVPVTQISQTTTTQITQTTTTQMTRTTTTGAEEITVITPTVSADAASTGTESTVATTTSFMSQATTTEEDQQIPDDIEDSTTAADPIGATEENPCGNCNCDVDCDVSHGCCSSCCPGCLSRVSVVVVAGGGGENVVVTSAGAGSE